ncbi:MAG: hypothetical protein U0840_19030 [Gemmataceae bacterium]
MSFDGDNCRSIDGDNYQSFADRPLFSSQGPGRDDISRAIPPGLLATLRPGGQLKTAVIRQEVLDLMDGTYLVTWVAATTGWTPTCRPMGRAAPQCRPWPRESLWVAIVEGLHPQHRDGFAGNYPRKPSTERGLG